MPKQIDPLINIDNTDAVVLAAERRGKGSHRIMRFLSTLWLTITIAVLSICAGATAAWLYFVHTAIVPAIMLLVFAALLAISLRLISRQEASEGTGMRLAQRYSKRDEAYRNALHAQMLYRYYFQAAPIGIVAADDTGVIESCNPRFAELLNQPATKCIGSNINSFTDKDLLVEGVSPIEIEVANRTLEVYRGETNVAAGAKHTANFHVLHFIDVSSRKELEQQVVQSQKMQAVGQLAGGIAHDFNNLLTAILGFCDLLLQRHTSGDPSFADINHIHQNANRAASLVRQLLAFSRQQKLNPQVMDVTDSLADLGHLLRRLLGETIELNVIHARDLWPVKVDRTQLEQVIINLAVNARDAMADIANNGDHKNGELSISTASETVTEARSMGTDLMPAGEYVVIRVSDTGTGIPDDIIDRIFDPFFSTKDVGAGTGLGLATVYGIIKQTDGFIDVTSKESPENQAGTTFTIYLPRSDEPLPTPVAVKASTQKDLTGSGTILLVEDEDPVRLFGARALRNKGYTVLEARSGEAALELLKAQKPELDLLVTDIMMPVIDGPTLIKIVRETNPSLKVVCISGYAEENMRERLDEQQNVSFLAKPFTLKQLAATVKAELDRDIAADVAA